MRVQVRYSDSSGNYNVRADVKPNNRLIHIIDIVDADYGGEADAADFTDDEMAKIQALILSEYDDLDSDDGDDYTNDESEDDEDADY